VEFDWSSYPVKEIPPERVAESFEDPFSLRVLPDAGPLGLQSRFICLGKCLDGTGLFSVYSSNGRVIRVVACRPMGPDELFFYERKAREAL
jgi:uncharacterized DUF497 family protein